jgi:hypothetical protein
MASSAAASESSSGTVSVTAPPGPDAHSATTVDNKSVQITTASSPAQNTNDCTLDEPADAEDSRCSCLKPTRLPVEYWLSTRVPEGANKWRAHALFSVDPLHSSRILQLLHQAMVYTSSSQFYGVVLVLYSVFLGSLTVHNPFGRNLWFFISYLLAGIFLLSVQTAHADRTLLWRMLHQHEYIFMITVVLTQFVATEATEIDMFHDSQDTDSIAYVRMILTLPLHLLVNLLLISLDSLILLRQGVRVVIPLLNLAYMVTRLVLDRIDPPRDPPEVCLWYCTTTYEIAGTATVYLIIFTLKYLLLIVFRPGELIIIHADTMYEVQGASRQRMDSLRVASEEYFEGSRYRSRNISAATSAAAAASVSANADDADDTDQTIADGLIDRTLSHTTPLRIHHAELQDRDNLGYGQHGQSGVSDTKDRAAARRASRFISLAASGVIVETIPISSGEPLQLSRPVLNSGWLKRITQFRYYRWIILTYVAFGIVVASLRLFVNRPLYIVLNVVAFSMLFCELTLCDMRLLKMLLGHFEYHLLIVSLIVYTLAGMADSYIGLDMDTDAAISLILFGYPQFFAGYIYGLSVDIMPLIPQKWKRAIVLTLVANSLRLFVVEYLDPSIPQTEIFCAYPVSCSTCICLS